MKHCVYVQGQISLVPRDIHLLLMLSLHCKGIVFLFPAILKWHSPIGKQFHVKEHVSLNVP